MGGIDLDHRSQWLQNLSSLTWHDLEICKTIRKSSGILRGWLLTTLSLSLSLVRRTDVSLLLARNRHRPSHENCLLRHPFRWAVDTQPLLASIFVPSFSLSLWRHDPPRLIRYTHKRR